MNPYDEINIMLLEASSHISNKVSDSIIHLRYTLVELIEPRTYKVTRESKCHNPDSKKNQVVHLVS